MIYILAGIVGMCGLICFCGLLEKLWDRLFPAEPVEKKSAPTVGAVEGTKTIYIDQILTQKGGVVK